MLKREEKGKFMEIVFFQGEEAEQPIKIYNRRGLSALVDYLKQWDYNENEIIETEYDKIVGRCDRIFEVDEYLVNINFGLPYVGLTKKVS